MIDWRVEVDSHDPIGWDRFRDGCWFPDFDHQEYLLTHFDVGETPIDPYGRTEFGAHDMKRLKVHLLDSYCYFESKPDSWTLTEVAAGESRIFSFERSKILMLLDKTLDMIEFALSLGGTLVFLGD